MEIVRRLVRRIIGHSQIYRAGATIIDFFSVIQKNDINTWRTLRKLQRPTPTSTSPTPVTLKNLRYPLLVRSGTKDAETIINNVIREEYGQFKPNKEPKWMIDAGAYIGDTAAYFLSRFSNLKVIALEPHPYNYEMASQNLKPYGEQAILLRKGLFSADQVLAFGGDGTGASIKGSGYEIECTSVLSLMDQYAIPKIDILKMDIEGAEEAIFLSNPAAWLARTDLLIIEIHGQDIHSLVFKVLSENDFSMRQYRSVWYCRPNH